MIAIENKLVSDEIVEKNLFATSTNVKVAAVKTATPARRWM